jgi:two-component system sensor histidine kinase/response regulator
VAEQELRVLQQDFRQYRSDILRATELAVIDPANATRHAYQG